MSFLTYRYIQIRLSAMPYVFSRGMYTTVTLLGTLSFAGAYFLGALLLSQVFTLRYILRMYIPIIS
jgi:uncharacterized metal-binding protein